MKCISLYFAMWEKQVVYGNIWLQSDLEKPFTSVQFVTDSILSKISPQVPKSFHQFIRVPVSGYNGDKFSQEIMKNTYGINKDKMYFIHQSELQLRNISMFDWFGKYQTNQNYLLPILVSVKFVCVYIYHVENLLWL